MSAVPTPSKGRIAANIAVALLMVSFSLASLTFVEPAAADAGHGSTPKQRPLSVDPPRAGATWDAADPVQKHVVNVENPIGDNDPWFQVVFALKDDPALLVDDIGADFELQWSPADITPPPGWELIGEGGGLTSTDCDGPDLDLDATDTTGGSEARAVLGGNNMCHSLIFQSTLDDHDIKPGLNQDFELAFELDGDPAGCVSAQCPVNPDDPMWDQRSIWINVLGVERDTNHFGAAWVRDPDFGFPAYEIVVDDLNAIQIDPDEPQQWFAPEPANLDYASAWTRDADNDGHIDRIEMFLTKKIDPEKLDISKINVGGKAGDISGSYDVLRFEMGDTVRDPPMRAPGTTDPSDPGDPGGEWVHQQLTLFIKEDLLYDTGEVPEFTIGNDAITSWAQVPNEQIDSGGVNYVDRAQPVLVSAVSAPERTDLYLIFSEGVSVLDTTKDETREFERKDWEYHLNWDETQGPSGTPATKHWVLLDEPPHTVPADPELVPTAGDFLHEPFENVAQAHLHPRYEYELENLEYIFNTATEEWLLNPQPDLVRIEAGVVASDEVGNWVFHNPDTYKETWFEGRPVGTVDGEPHEFGIVGPQPPSGEDHPEVYDLHQEEPVGEPRMITADGNIGFEGITGTFNTPVETADQGAALAHHFDVKTGKGLEEGLSGIVKSKHIECAEKAILTMDGRLRPDDVDLDGDRTKIRTRADELFACWTGNPDRNLDPIPVREIDTPIVDVTKPTILEALTRDVTQDGRIDSYDFKFSEPVDDSDFRPECLIIDGHPTDTVPYQLDTKLGNLNSTPDDEFIRITFIEDDQRLTGTVPQIFIVCDAFRDLAKSPEADRQGNPIEAIQTKKDLIEKDGANPRVMRAQTVDENGDGLIDGYRLTFTEPVNDTSLMQTFVHQPQGVDPSHPDNERLDDWQVGNTGNLTVKGEYDVIDIDTGDARNDSVATLIIQQQPLDSENPVGDTGTTPELRYEPRDDKRRLLKTGVLEDLVGNALLSFEEDGVVEQDNARPVLMAGLACDGFEQMKVIFSEPVEGLSNTAQNGVLIEDDLTYINAGGDAETASGIKTLDHKAGDVFAMAELKGVVTQDDLDTDQLQPKKDTTPGVDSDTGLIKEMLGSLQTRAQGDRINVTEATDITPPDWVDNLAAASGGVQAAQAELFWTVPEDFGCKERGVTDYKVAYANEPFDKTDGDDQTIAADDRVDYFFFNPVTEENETESGDAGGITVEGDTQRAWLKGLKPETTYHIRIAPMDKAGNTGEYSNLIEITTPEDPDPPLLPDPFEITSPTHPQPTPSKNPLPRFAWDRATDPESGFVEYHFALDRSPEFEVTTDNPSVSANNITFDAAMVANATGGGGLEPRNWWDEPVRWFFHLAACSGGGCVPMGQYEVQIDSKYARADMYDINQALGVRATEFDGEYTVAWDVPADNVSAAANPPSGVQIWRRPGDDHNYTLIAETGARDRIYQEGRFTDNSGAATKESRYLVTLSLQNRPDDSDPDDDYGYFPTDDDGELLLNPLEAGPDDNRSYDGIEAQVTDLDEPPIIPLWVWILMGILLLLIITGAVLFFVLRQGAEEQEAYELDELEEEDTFGAQEEPEEAEGGANEDAGGETDDETAEAAPQAHTVTCPACQQKFDAQGTRPLQITCPHCNASGTLQ